MNEIIAFDKEGRFRDENGFLHVPRSKITKAGVNRYHGKEIPRHKELGLDANGMYNMLRPEDEIAKGAKTFNGLPFLSEHIGVTSKSLPKDKLLGSMGNDAEVEDGALFNSLVIFDERGIDMIEKEGVRGLSLGYQYDADMTPGIYNGIQYDGVMRNIRGNHIMPCVRGRAGSDIVVGDEDNFFNIGGKMSGLMKKLLDKLKGASVIAEDSLDGAEKAIAEVLEEEEGIKSCEKIDDKKDAEIIDKDKSKEVKKEQAMDSIEMVSKIAMDEALRNQSEKITSELTKKFAAEAKYLREATESVRPLVGAVALDSADEVYRYALEKVGAPISGVPPEAYPAMVKMAIEARKNSITPRAKSRPMAMDSDSLEASGFNLKTRILGD